ncbi:M24 family metallopeptidase [Microvirga brassicacearum]|uniref:M24 family metallopeptidase n=1 Tax=Microvirga brassicacearum TaxID=2580413 RepID=A0A5N3PE82_9HYPH|nr:M24 family metallopeptidase [Microvirga brassicacearum]KAB0268057.1 M24 family metallopeptidase [Microvirga brassicacearum]
MTARLYASLDRVIDRLGFELGDQLTYPGIYRGSPLNVSPVVIEQGGKISAVVSEADSDACRVMTPGVTAESYGRYFSWDRDMSAPVTSFAQAVRKITGPEAIACEATLPVSRYEMLADSGPVTLFDLPDSAELFVYRKTRSDIEALWIATRDADAARFAPFVAGLRNGDALVAAMTAHNRGFAPLDALCRERGFQALYVTAAHEVEMFTGLPSAVIEQYGISALFNPDETTILLLSARAIDGVGFAPAGRADGLAAALLATGAQRIGFQKDHLATGIYLPLAEAELELEDAAYVLRRWQDRRAGDDLVYFIFAANAVLKGISAARALLTRNAEGKLTERDLVAVYHQAVRRFARRYGFENRVSSYFDIVHSGARTLLPATAGDYPVSTRDKTIKFDMGLMVADAFGCLRGCSDIARTICADSEIEALHDRLRTILVDELIPAIRPGMTGQEVHAVGVDCLRPLEADLRRLGLLPEGMNVDSYLRDCGHTIQRQTISSVYFLPGVTETIEEGMLGCTEYVWPIGEILIAIEDGYLVTESGAIPFTAEA